MEFVNREHRRLFDSDAWHGKPIRVAFPDIAGQGFFELLDEVYATGVTKKASAAPVRYRQPGSGVEKTRYVDFIYAPFFDVDGRMSGVFCEGFDVTDRVEATAELLSTEEQLRLATDAADIGWWDVEQGYGRLFWPPRVKAMFGISPNAPVSMDDFYAGLHPDDRDAVAATYAGAADPARRALYDVEYRTIGKEDGVLRWVAAKGRGVFDETGRCVRMVGTAIDITERKRAQEEKLARQMEDAELREQFIAVLGHDLRNPLASVAAGTRILVRSPEKAAEIAGHIERSITRMSELIENVLDFARGRLGGGFVTARDAEQPLEPVLLQVVDELRGVHPERGGHGRYRPAGAGQMRSAAHGPTAFQPAGQRVRLWRIDRRPIQGARAGGGADSSSFVSRMPAVPSNRPRSTGSSSRSSAGRSAAAARVSALASISARRSPRPMVEPSMSPRTPE